MPPAATSDQGPGRPASQGNILRLEAHLREHVPATHAWAECFLPDLGWTEFDLTNPELPSERRVRVAVGRDYDDVSPTRGVFVGDTDSLLEVSVRMRRVE